MKNLYLSFTCLLLITINLSAQNRWRLATSGKDVEVYYDKEGMTRTQKGTIRVWIKYVYTRKDTYINHSTELEEYQCSERMSRTLSQTSYNQSGDVVNSPNVRNLRWDFVTPDTIGETLFKIVCEGKKDLQLKYDEEAENESRIRKAEDEKLRILNLAQKYYEQGSEYQKNGSYIEAIKAFKQAIQLNPNDEVSYYNLGKIYTELKNYPQAINSFQQSIRLDTKGDWASFVYPELGKLYEKLNRPADALQLYKQESRAFPNDADVYIKLGDIYKSIGKHNEATNTYKQAVEAAKNEIQNRPTASYPYYKLANAQEKLSLDVEVVETYKLAVNRFPKDCDLYFNLSRSLEKIGKLSEAVESYKRALILKQANTSEGIYCYSLEELYLQLTSIYEKLKEFSKAIDLLKEAIGMDSKNAYFYYSKLGGIYKQMGSRNESIAAYRQAIQLSPDSAGAYFGLGEVYEELGQNDDALSAYQKAINLNNKSRKAHLALGKLYLKIGNKDAAIEEYKRLKIVDEKTASELYKLIYK